MHVGSTRRLPAPLLLAAALWVSCSGSTAPTVDTGPLADTTISRDADASLLPDTKITDSAVEMNWRWEKLPPLLHARQRAQAVVVEGKVYVLGNPDTPEMERYDPTQNKWEIISSMPAPYWLFAAEAIGQKIYVAGGTADFSDFYKMASKKLQIFDTEMKSWSDGPEMPHARRHASALVREGKLWIVGGGVNPDDLCDAIDIFDLVTNTWSTLPTQVPTPRDTVIAVAMGSTLYLAGGFPGDPFSQEGMYGTNKVETYSISDGAWSNAPDLLMARGQSGGGLVNWSLVVVGGWGPGEYGDTERLEEGGAQWIKLPDLPVPCAGPAVTVLDGELFVAGGGTYGQGSWTSQANVYLLKAH